MKKIPKAMILVVILSLLLSCFAGCAKEELPDYPVMEMMDLEGVTLESSQDTKVKVSYPAGLWTQQTEMATLTMMYTESMGSGEAFNINIQHAGAAKDVTLTEKDKETLMESLEAQGQLGFTIDKSEMRLLNNAPVIYMESSIKMTEELLDMALNNGLFTEEQLEAIGGKEVFLSMPATQQLSVYAVVKDELFLYMGTYYTEEQKEIILDTITVMVRNTEKL